MTEGESKQLTEVSNDVKWIIKSIEEMRSDFKDDISNVIESQNCKNKTIDERISCVEKEQNEIKTKTAVSTTKLTSIIAGITFVLTMVAQAVFTAVTESLKK